MSSKSQYVCGGDIYNIAKALASTTGWNTYFGGCYVGGNPSSNNFSTVPAGFYNSNYRFFCKSIGFWSVPQHSSDDAYSRHLYYDFANVFRSHNNKAGGLSVRCLKD
ncbi:MAG: fibrobacter succinogenes major paralogous domain-containing protein [Bacteroidales bacterium]|nr:fibrobacter succinogenes major paralogous domain-containing protein [Bacteroidales bacterium]